MKFVDTHCHIQMPAYAADADAVFKNARNAEIGMVVVGTNAATSHAAIAFAERQGAHVWATAGIHPGHVHAPHHDKQEITEPPKEEFFDPKLFAEFAKSKKLVAIGETGLDYYRIEAGGGRTLEEIKKRQQDNFISHIAFAHEHQLPLVVHVRDAHADVISIIASEQKRLGRFKGVIHCFSGTVSDALQYIELGFLVSFTGTLTFPPKKSSVIARSEATKQSLQNPLTEVAKAIPLSHILIETDAPWLTPRPLRGERNEPANVRIIAQTLADLRKVSVEEIAEQTTKNAVTLFNLAD